MSNSTYISFDASQNAKNGVVSSERPLPVTSLSSVPTDGLNPSMVLGYTGTNLTTIDKQISGNTYEKTLGWTGTNLTSISAWVKL